MDDPSVGVIKAGYLHVKLPAGVRGIGKAWMHRWVIIKPYKVIEDKKTVTGILFEILKSDKVAATCTAETKCSQSASNIAHKRHVSTNCALFLRSFSRKQPYAFTAAEGKDPVIHLAGNSETESQQWMAALRNALWPPSQLVQLEKVLSGCLYEVSFIDNKFSHKASLLGCYGYLAISGNKLTLFNPPTGHVIQEWYLDTIELELVPQLCTEDSNKVFSMKTAKTSSTGSSEFLLFSAEAEAIVKHVHQRQSDMGKHPSCYHDDLTEVAEFWPTPTTLSPDIVKEENTDQNEVTLRSAIILQSRSLAGRPISDSFVEREVFKGKGDTNKNEYVDDGTYAVPPRPHSIFCHPSVPRSMPCRDFLHIPDKLLNCSLSASMLNSAEHYNGQRTSSDSSQETSSMPPSPQDKPADWDEHFNSEDLELRIKIQQRNEEAHYDSPSSFRTVDNHQCCGFNCRHSTGKTVKVDVNIEHDPSNTLERQESLDSVSELPMKDRTASNTSTDSHVYIEVPPEVTKDKRPSVVTLYEEMPDDDDEPAEIQEKATIVQPPLPPRPDSLHITNGNNAEDTDSTGSPTSPQKSTWGIKRLIRRSGKGSNIKAHSESTKNCNGYVKSGGIASAIKMSTETIGAGLLRNSLKPRNHMQVKRVKSAPQMAEQENYENTSHSYANSTKEETTLSQSSFNGSLINQSRRRSHTWPPNQEMKKKDGERECRRRNNSTSSRLVVRRQLCSDAEKEGGNSLENNQRMKCSTALIANLVIGEPKESATDYCYMKPVTQVGSSVIEQVTMNLKNKAILCDESEYVDMKSDICDFNVDK